jgi:endonuclease/exonuclease/phosphatase (EEP) superfamily protein YafD
VLLNLDHLGTPLTFIGTHPDAPMGGLHAREWRSQLSQIGSTVAAIDGEVIVAGDFNATPWCEGMRLAAREKRPAIPLRRSRLAAHLGAQSAHDDSHRPCAAQRRPERAKA